MSHVNLDSLYIDGKWINGTGPVFQSKDPVTGEVIWNGPSASTQDVQKATLAATKALSIWKSTSFDDRCKFVKKYAQIIADRKDELAILISKENGKPLWEAKTEVSAVIAKAEISITAEKERRSNNLSTTGSVTSATRYKPLGVVGILGPFNFPCHLANGHLIPALLAGNTVLFKPSELTPAAANFMAQAWHDAGLPAGTLQVLHGSAKTGAAILNQKELRGLFFTGSSKTGILIRQALAHRPEVLAALEMGGNNALVVDQNQDHESLIQTIIPSAFITAGQRCTCARRLIVIEDPSTPVFLSKLKETVAQIPVGHYLDSPEPYIGPVISNRAADDALRFQDQLIQAGGNALVLMSRIKPETPLLQPGLIDVTSVAQRPDEEIFAPFLQVIRVKSLDEAITETNNTCYGLAAGLLSNNEKNYQTFYNNVHTGLINWNNQLTGASSKSPFGGIGHSGNYRPSAYFATDYCSYAVASLEQKELPEIPLSWKKDPSKKSGETT